MLGTVDKRFSDSRGELRIRYHGDQLVVGRDSPFIRLMARYGRHAYPHLPTIHDVTIDDTIALGFFTRSHVLDCRSADPANYTFELHSTEAHVARGRDLASRRVGDAGWHALRQYGMYEFARCKQLARLDFAYIEYDVDGARVAYRRLILPLSGDGREVSHLLIAFIHDERPVYPGALKQVRR